jgi:hypothetical protein
VFGRKSQRKYFSPLHIGRDSIARPAPLLVFYHPVEFHEEGTQFDKQISALYFIYDGIVQYCHKFARIL